MCADNIIECDPSEMATILFHNNDDQYGMIGEIDDFIICDLFEILLTILLEGFQKIGIKDLSNMDESTIESLNPYMQKIGFQYRVSQCDKYDKSEYEEYYCRILLRNESNEHFFQMKGLTNMYHFILNGTYLESNKSKQHIDQLYSIFEVDNYVYTIKFKIYRP